MLADVITDFFIDLITSPIFIIMVIVMIIVKLWLANKS